MSSASRPSAGSMAVAVLLAVALVGVAGLPGQRARAEVPPGHLVVSEIVTGGTSASDEFIEIYNPTSATLPLEGLELVYVTATGATISRRAAWELGAPGLGAGRHLLVANELGAFAGIADAIYASGMAATGGSVALRIQGAITAIDAVGWGTAASTWLEGLPAAAPAAGSSLERLPGGTLGSTVDTGDNQSDFAVRAAPEPQNLGSAPVPEPGATLPPGPTPPPSPTAEPSVVPTPTPVPEPTVAATPGGTVPIGTARGLPDGTLVVVEGTALSDADFTDGGGFVADESGGIAVLVTGGTFDRGDRLRLGGSIDDRFSQRTLRVDAADLVVLGTGSDPAPASVSTGAVDEGEEGGLVRVGGVLTGSASDLSSGMAFDLDDGTGPTRLVVATATGIDVSGWDAGVRLDLVGVVGQRDSTGSGATGYRVQPRDSADVLTVDAAPTATPQPSGSASAEPTPSVAPPTGVITIAAARTLPKNARARVSGTVTMAPGVVDPTTAVIQDATGAIVLRIGEDVGPLSRGEVVTVDGVRSTKSGMETLRVTTATTRSGQAAEPAARELRTGAAGEGDEARLVVVRGAIVAAARRSSSGSVSFELDDGSGPLRITLGAAVGAEHGSLTGGSWLQVTGVLGQVTTGAQPLRGYRVWPRNTGDIRTLAAPTDVAAGSGQGNDADDAPGAPAAGLDAIGGAAGDSVRIGATLVSGAWPQLDIGGLLWDGSRLVALEASAVAAVEGILDGRRAPLSVELSGLRAVGALGDLGLPMVGLGDEPGALLPSGAPVAAPATSLPDDGEAPRWVAIVGRLLHADGATRLALPRGRSVELDVRCERTSETRGGTVGVIGVATAAPSRIVVPCGGILPAPALDRAGTAASVDPAPPAAARLAGLEDGEGDRLPLPIGPVALLGLAALGLAGGALVARRSWDDDPETDQPDAPSSDEPAEGHAPPTLTLVPLPRDRAP